MKHFTVEKSFYLWKVQLHQKVGWTKQVRQEALLLCKELLFDPRRRQKRKRKGSRSDKLASSDNWGCLRSSFSLLHKCLISFQRLITARLSFCGLSEALRQGGWAKKTFAGWSFWSSSCIDNIFHCVFFVLSLEMF